MRILMIYCASKFNKQRKRYESNTWPYIEKDTCSLYCLYLAPYLFENYDVSLLETRLNKLLSKNESLKTEVRCESYGQNKIMLSTTCKSWMVQLAKNLITA